ncbi:hypothetical protein HRbin40_01130 [bacterium HR40]|nr:hypothetical protein HRbin40_01130 [bacterium HR40]
MTAVVWRERAVAARLGPNRLHLQHGPIDLLVDVEGPAPSVEAALTAARRRFDGLLEGLCAVLPVLRRPIPPGFDAAGLPETAQRMIEAVRPYHPIFVTPMAAVAGAVADTILAAMRRVPGLGRAIVNNRGDIALSCPHGRTIRTGVVTDLARPVPTLVIETGPEIGGIATSGREGRSFSLGIADAVTVLADDGATADAAATLVANAVDLDHPAVERRPAASLDPDSDLGGLPVVTRLGPLGRAEVAAALDAGAAFARSLVAIGRIRGAVLALRGQLRIVGEVGRLAHGAPARHRHHRPQPGEESPG